MFYNVCFTIRTGFNSEAVPFESVPLMSLPNSIRERERVYADAAALAVSVLRSPGAQASVCKIESTSMPDAG